MTLFTMAWSFVAGRCAGRTLLACSGYSGCSGYVFYSMFLFNVREPSVEAD